MRESGYEAAYQLVHGELPQPSAPRLALPARSPGNLLAVVLIAVGLLALPGLAQRQRLAL